MTDYKSKYLQMKLKYINAKHKLKGGTSSSPAANGLFGSSLLSSAPAPTPPPTNPPAVTPASNQSQEHQYEVGQTLVYLPTDGSYHVGVVKGKFIGRYQIKLRNGETKLVNPKYLHKSIINLDGPRPSDTVPPVVSHSSPAANGLFGSSPVANGLFGSSPASNSGEFGGLANP